MKARIISLSFSGSKTFSKNRGRNYFCIKSDTGEATVTFGGGNGSLTIAEGNFYEPYATPTEEIAITTTGTYTVLIDGES